jgi:hypothetical protein
MSMTDLFEGFPPRMIRLNLGNLSPSPTLPDALFAFLRRVPTAKTQSACRRAHPASLAFVDRSDRAVDDAFEPHGAGVTT